MAFILGRAVRLSALSTRSGCCLARRLLSTNTAPKVAVVTGGAQGIGLASCLELAGRGYDVVCGDIDEAARHNAEKTWKDMGLSVGSLTTVPFNAAKAADCKLLVERATDHFGRVDALFNNVGIQPDASNVPLHELDEEMWDDIMNVNLKSFFRMSKLVVPLMLARGGGAIVNNASIQGIQSQRGVPAYAASKGGILSLTRHMAVHYGANRIRVNSVSPGSTMTPLLENQSGDNSTDVAYATNNTPLGRLGRPADIAKVVAFLLSDDAGWVTGQNITIDGGITVKGGWCPLGEADDDAVGW